MAKGKKAKETHLKKNRVSMKDVLDHSTAVLATAISALLSRPDPLTEDEALDVYAEASHIFIKAQEALQFPDAEIGREVFISCMKLLGAGFDQEPGIRAQGAECFADAVLQQTLNNIFLHVVVGAEFRGDDGRDFAALEAFIDVIDLACEGTVATKVSMGAMCMASFAKMMVQADDYPPTLLRNVCRCMIKLIVSCKQNKDRLGAWGFLGESFTNSTDVYFQIQVAELIFRIGREKKAFFSNLDLPVATIKYLKALPNNPKLMDLIVELVEDFNDTREPRLVIAFPIQQFIAGGPTSPLSTSPS